jgi:hypothetical protein
LICVPDPLAAIKLFAFKLIVRSKKKHLIIRVTFILR